MVLAACGTTNAGGTACSTEAQQSTEAGSCLSTETGYLVTPFSAVYASVFVRTTQRGHAVLVNATVARNKCMPVKGHKDRPQRSDGVGGTTQLVIDLALLSLKHFQPAQNLLYFAPWKPSQTGSKYTK
jgi:hypothetical protein